VERRNDEMALGVDRKRPSKRLGQHFLLNPAVARRVVELAQVNRSDTVLEIGPGKGALSEFLAARAARLYLVEVDRDLARELQERFCGLANVKVICADILELDLKRAFAEEPIKVVANLPYNIATELLFRLLAHREKFPDLTLMLQREVARRLLARRGTPEYGIPTLLVQLYAEVTPGFAVGPGNFYPRPKVVSEVVRLKVSAHPRFPLAGPKAEEIFAALVRAAFGQRRKMLRSALLALCERYRIERADWEGVLAEAGVSSTLRGEEIAPQGFVALANAVARRLAADTEKALCPQGGGAGESGAPAGSGKGRSSAGAFDRGGS